MLWRCPLQAAVTTVHQLGELNDELVTQYPADGTRNFFDIGVSPRGTNVVIAFRSNPRANRTVVTAMPATQGPDIARELTANV